MNSFQARMNTATQALGVLMVFVLIFPTALVNVVLLLLLLSYALSGNWAGKWQRISSNPVARAALVLLGMFAAGMLYSSVSMRVALSELNSYRELLLLPIVISLFDQVHWRQRAYHAFLLSIGLAVLLSFAMRLGWLPPGPVEQEWVPFKGRIAYGFFLAFAVYLMLHHAMLAGSAKRRLLWLACAVVSAIDLFYLVSGRTGHIIMLGLLALLLFQYRARAKRHWMVIALALSVLAVTVTATSPAIRSRSSDIQRAETSPEGSSIGLRLIFWQTSLRIIADHPLLGAGTGSFEHEFPAHANQYASLNADNPHNEFLLIACQLGVVGLLGFLWLFYCQVKSASRLPPRYGIAAQGLVVAMAVGCLFNSFLHDHGEGHFFAIYAGLLFSAYLPESPAAAGTEA